MTNIDKIVRVRFCFSSFVPKFVLTKEKTKLLLLESVLLSCRVLFTAAILVTGVVNFVIFFTKMRYFFP